MTDTLMHVDREDLLVLGRSLTREWLETDGRGGYASSSVLMCATRRYHGLLVAPPPGSARRHVFLSRFEETFHGGGKSFAISLARYPGHWGPHGHQGLEAFDLRPNPCWTYVFGRARLEREVLMAKGEHTVLVRYRVTGQQNPVELHLRPLLACRDAHHLTHENLAADTRATRIEGGVSARPYGALPVVSITLSTRARFEADPVWYKRVEYQSDLARGYDGHEDNLSPGWFEVPIASGVDVYVAATIGPPVRDPAALWAREKSARAKVLEGFEPGVRDLLAATADDFLYRTEKGRLGVIAGYPWFGEWGRDAYISLPGLLLARDRVDECRQALEGALAFVRDGLLPNVFGAGVADSAYNSVDASLWFSRAVRLYDLAAGDGAGRRFRGALEDIAGRYLAGTDLCRGDPESGLLRAGDPRSNVTWMDAMTADGPVTPRDGFAVEINALWCFLLAYLEELARRDGDDRAARGWGSLKRRAGASFVERFWLPEEKHLADVWKDGVADASVRPNMVIAASLEWSPLSRGMRTDVVRRATATLLTPFGLRTLEPHHPAYRGRYGGALEARDAAYHQGTVWPWLIGPYCEAYLRAYGPRPRRLEILRDLLDGFAAQLSQQGLLHVSEVLDGDPPHRPGGTFAQAWNSAEILRAYRLLEVQR